MPSTIAEEKAELRAWIQAESAFRSPAARRVSDAALHARFLALPQVRLARTLLLFWGVGTEPDTLPLIDELLAQGKRVALPRCLPHRGVSGGGGVFQVQLLLLYHWLPHSAGRAAGALYLRLSMPLRLVSGAAAQNPH